MDIKIKDITPHPRMLDVLFAHKRQVTSLLEGILRIDGIDHIAITYINQYQELFIVSSTPAIEFNLFSGQLWRMDYTYRPVWFNKCTQASWQSLYLPERYDELYYLKQQKNHYPFGQSFASQLDGLPMIFSIASHTCCLHKKQIIKKHHQLFYETGRECAKVVFPE